MNFYSYFGTLWISIFSVCVLGDIIRENDFEAEFSNIHKGRMLRVLMVFNNLRLDKCAVKCIQHIRCKTINYNFEKLKCELTDVDFNENEADKLSYDWYNIGTHPRVDGGWGKWQNVTQCVASCGGGTMNQARDCDSPAPQHGGHDCVGKVERTIECNTHPCPVNGRWGKWKNVDSCTTTCGGGTLNQARYCDSPKPQHGGDECVGNGERTIGCNTYPCPDLPVIGGGTMIQARDCDSPAPQHGGHDCVGKGEKTIKCNTHSCPDYLIQIAGCKREKGFCVKKNGHDQNDGVILINEANRDREAEQNECLRLCLQRKDATGCEVIWDKGNRGCYLHTQPIDRGSNHIKHCCWVFSKCHGVKSIQDLVRSGMVGKWRLSYSNGHIDTYSITEDGFVTLGSNKVSRRFEQSNFQDRFLFSQGWLIVRNLFRAAVWEYVRLGADGVLEVHHFCTDGCSKILNGVGQYCCSASRVRET